MPFRQFIHNDLLFLWQKTENEIVTLQSQTLIELFD